VRFDFEAWFTQAAHLTCVKSLKMQKLEKYSCSTDHVQVAKWLGSYSAGQFSANMHVYTIGGSNLGLQTSETWQFSWEIKYSGQVLEEQ